MKRLNKKNINKYSRSGLTPYLGAVVILLTLLLLGQRGNSDCALSYPTKLGAVYVLKTTVSVDSDQNNSLFPKLVQIINPLSDSARSKLSQNRSVLILPDNSTLTLLVDQTGKALKDKKNINLSDYQNQRVFVTGKLIPCRNTLTISGENDIQPLP